MVLFLELGEVSLHGCSGVGDLCERLLLSLRSGVRDETRCLGSSLWTGELPVTPWSGEREGLLPLEETVGSGEMGLISGVKFLISGVMFMISGEWAGNL